MADFPALAKNSLTDITHFGPSQGPVELESEVESLTTTDAGGSNKDFNKSQLLGDYKVGENETEDDITSIPTYRVLTKIRDKSFKTTAYAKITLNGPPFLPKASFEAGF